MLPIGTVTYADLLVFTGRSEILERDATNVRIRVSATQARLIKSYQAPASQSIQWDAEFEETAKMLEAEHVPKIVLSFRLPSEP
jgi:hypothetical protein